MWEIVRSIAFALLPVPDQHNPEPEALLRWRYAVAASIIVLGGIEVAFILAAVGYLSFVGINGYASTADIAPLVRQGQETRITQIETRITNDRILQCQAIMESNQAAMNYSYFRLQEDVDAYTAAAKRGPRIPDCGELIPAGSGGVIAPTPRPTAATK